jgi:DNA-binding transcriptional LysR family regulator
MSRLRELTGDPLFVRGKSSMVPTEYGLRLIEPVQNALREIERITLRHNFDPATPCTCSSNPI